MRVVVIPINSEISEVEKAFDQGADVVVHETSRFSGKASIGHYCDVTTRSDEFRDRIKQELEWSLVANAPEGHFTFRIFEKNAEQVIAERVLRFLGTGTFPP